MADTRTDDEWRGATEARLAMLERRFEAADTRAGVLGTAVTGVQTDMRILQSKQDQVTLKLDRLDESIREDAEARAAERDEERKTTIRDLETTIAQKGISREQKIAAAVLAFVTAFVGPMTILAITGHLT